MMKALPKSQKAGVAGVGETCACFGLQRDAWYKYQKRAKYRNSLKNKVIELVKEERNAFNGLALVIVRSVAGKAGTITVKAKSAGLTEAQVTIKSN